MTRELPAVPHNFSLPPDYVSMEDWLAEARISTRDSVLLVAGYVLTAYQEAPITFPHLLDDLRPLSEDRDLPPRHIGFGVRHLLKRDYIENITKLDPRGDVRSPTLLPTVALVFESRRYTPLRDEVEGQRGLWKRRTT